MFNSAKKKKQDAYRQTIAEVNAVQRCFVAQFHPLFVRQHGHLLGGRLAQAVVDKLFGRPSSLSGGELGLAERLTADIAAENLAVRNAAFISLRAMLQVEGASGNFAAERRIMDTIQWLKQFGEIPADSCEPQAVSRMLQTVRVDPLFTPIDRPESHIYGKPAPSH
jgi:hypothetical protein